MGSKSFKSIELRVPSQRFANWDQFVAQAPEYSIGLEVMDDTPGHRGHYVHFDHHAGVIREATMSAAMQAYIAVRQGRLMERWLDRVKPVPVYVWNADQDVCLASFILEYHELLEQKGSPVLRQVVQFNNKIDVCGGLYPVDLDEIVANHFTWIFEPYMEQRTLGRTPGDGPLIESVIRGVCDRVLALLEGRAGIAEIKAQPEILYESPYHYVIADEKGDPNSRLVLAARGYRNFISLVTTRPNGRYTYSVIRGSPYDDDVFELPKLLEAFQAAEDTPRVWGGSNMAAGSDSELGSSLHWTKLRDIAEPIVREAYFKSLPYHGDTPPAKPPDASNIDMPETSEANPLLSIEFRVPFDRIRAEHVEPAIGELLEQARARLAAVAGETGERTFRNTMHALDVMTEPLEYAMGVVRHLESVATTPELRAAFNAVQPPVSAFYSGIPLNAELWQGLKAFARTGEAAALKGERRRYLDKTLESFRRHGADLDPAGKKRMEELDVELAQVTTKFGENVLDSTNAFELILDNEAALAGLPPTAVAAARESAARKGKEGWRFTLQAPDYTAVMTYLNDASVRRKVYEAFAVRATEGAWDNRPLVGRILALRAEKARLLGFGDFADLVLEDRMAHKGARALAFLEDLKIKTEAKFRAENRELLEFRRSIEGPSAPELEPWDVGYYAEKQRAALYDFDEEALRPYFPAESVLAGLFELVSRLYGVRVTEVAGAPVWDPEVRYYEIHDANSEFLGGFYADWRPRDNKRGGAWMGVLLTGGPEPERFRPHLGYICGNLTPPVGGKPALLTHREVETIFHEFGHLLHHLFSRVETRSLAGTNVAWDFVELPSQIMENWCWERGALDLFARHWETGEPIPDGLFQKMKRARTFRAANGQMRQLGFGFIDLLLHTRYDAARDGDATEYARRILQEFSPAPLPANHAMAAAFTHLFADPVGYGAGYYSYKWAEVLDADAFTRFRDGGIFSSEVGGEFRSKILAKGDSEDPAELYRSFMGREPDPRALLVRSGLA